MGKWCTHLPVRLVDCSWRLCRPTSFIQTPQPNHLSSSSSSSHRGRRESTIAHDCSGRSVRGKFESKPFSCSRLMQTNLLICFYNNLFAHCPENCVHFAWLSKNEKLLFGVESIKHYSGKRGNQSKPSQGYIVCNCCIGCSEFVRLLDCDLSLKPKRRWGQLLATHKQSKT